MTDTSLPEDPETGQDAGNELARENEQAPGIEEPERALVEVEPLSFSDKLVGIYTEPSAVYENVRDAGARASDWVPPLLIALVIFTAGMYLRFSNPEFISMIQEQQLTALEEQVAEGNMTEEQLEQAQNQFDQVRGFIKIFGTLSATIGFVFFFFLLAGIYWLLLRYGFKGAITFKLVLSTYGLILFITALDQIVSLLLMVITGNPLASLSPALLMEPNLTDKLYKVFQQLNLFTIWSYVVLGLGFSIVAHISRGKGMAAAFAALAIAIVLQVAFT